MNGTFRIIATIALFFTLNCSAKAGVLLPDIAVGPLSGAYNSSDSATETTTDMFGQTRGIEANTLFLQGAAASLDIGVSPLQLIYFGGGIPMPGLFELSAAVDGINGGVSTINDPSLGGFGKFTISGTLGGVGGMRDTTLLQGTLTDLKMSLQEPSGGQKYTLVEFLGTITDDGTSEFGVGSDFVIRFNASVTFSTFTQSFGLGMLDDMGSADVGRPVPEPGSVAFWASLCCVIGLRRRRGLAQAEA